MSSKKPDTRSRILKSTWKLLEDGNSSDARMSDIAKHVGISRQALYLHFPNRADLLVATTRYIDDINKIDARLAASRAAASGEERLTSFIQAWGNYIPEIHGVARALMGMMETDQGAATAWHDRMQAMRSGCRAAIVALKADGLLSSELTTTRSTDMLWTLLSVRNWEQLRLECGWSQKQYVQITTRIAKKILMA